MSPDGYTVLCWVLSVAVLLGFAGFAIGMAFKKQGSTTTTENFLTARHQVGLLRTAWSFYASAVGAWVFTGPPSYAAFAGWIGIISYAVSAGMPIVVIAFLGDVIQGVLPEVLSLSDFVGWRYGVVPQTFVVLLTTFNMSVALLAEYTTVGSLFSSYVGSVALPIILVVGTVTMTYTAFGGLLVSIITDQVQGMASLTFFAVLTVYVAITFRYPLPQPMPAELAANSYGYSSLFSMPVSMLTATVFSEAIWQRVWASSTPKGLKAGAVIGAAGVILVVGLAGLAGWLAWWAGLVGPESNPNLYLFAVLQPPTGADPRVTSAIGVLALVLAVTMNESAVDSLQNGLIASLGGHFLKGKPLIWARISVVAINVPLVLLGAMGFQVLELFLMTNMVCSSSALPVLAGLLRGPAKRLITGEGMVLSCLLAAFSVSAFGVSQQWVEGASTATNFSTGLRYTWLGNGYDWPYLAIPIFSSAGYLLLSALVVWLLRERLGICRGNLPGFRPKGGAELGAWDYTHPADNLVGSEFDADESDGSDMLCHNKEEGPDGASPSHSKFRKGSAASEVEFSPLSGKAGHPSDGA